MTTTLMKTMETIEIPLSKNKILLLLIGAISFVVIGVTFSFQPERFSSSLFDSPILIRVIGIFSFVFFGICLWVIYKKFKDTKAGLSISEEGIVDNSNGLSIGLVPWVDITGIRTIQVFTQRIIMIDVKNPEDYIAKGKGMMAKRAMKANWKMYDSPISVIATSLKIDFDSLEALLYEEIQKRTFTEQ